MKLNKFEILSYIVLLSVVIGGVVIAFFYTEYLSKYTKEDGILEYSTAVFLFFGAIYSLIRFGKNVKKKNILIALTSIGFFLALLFVAGEEISWGQRIFGIESSEYFKKQNTQSEMNLHNLKIMGVKINMLIFGKMLSFALAVYFMLVPFLYNRIKFIKQLLNKLGVPVVKYHHSIIAAIASILIFLIPTGVKWEIFEFAFSLLILMIIIYPTNKQVIG